MGNKKQNIVTYLSEENPHHLMSILKSIIQIGKIIKDFHQSGYLLGSVDLENFIVIDKDLATLHLLQEQPLLKKGEEIPQDYKLGELSAMCVRQRRSRDISERSDVELLGKIFMKFILPERDIEGYKELRYLAYELGMFREDIPFELYQWIDGITSLYQDKQFESVQKVIDEAERVINQIETNTQSSQADIPEYFYSCMSHPGRGKITNLTEEQIKSIKWINQDAVGVYEVEERLFAFVADGVSRCTYGSGYEAAQIIEQVCKEEVLCKLKGIEPQDVTEFFSEIVKRANKKIWEVAQHYITHEQLLPNDEGIMASTFVGCLVITNKAYIVSIGDSRVLIYRQGRISPLTIEQNLGNKRLSEGMLWGEYIKLENPSALTHYIGGMPDLHIKVREISMKSGDVLILCSDGLTDYLNDLGKKNDLWNMNENMEKILRGINTYNIGQVNARLIDEANYKGGWDNISSILITRK